LGLNVYFKIENPAGARIQELFVHGKRPQLDKKYIVSFVTSQGVPLGYGTERKDLEVRATEAMQQFLAKGALNADLRGSIVAV